MEESWSFLLKFQVLCLVCSVSFAELPRLSSAPTISSLHSDGVTVEWSAWSAGTDSGDGPVASYIAVARNTPSNTDAAFPLSVDAGDATVFKVEPLMFEQQYDIAVVCVDSNGNRGDPSPILTVTLPCGVPTESAVLETLEPVSQTALRLAWSAPPQSSWRCSSLDDLMISYKYKLSSTPDFPLNSGNPKTAIIDGGVIIDGLDACSTYDVIVYTYASTANEYSTVASDALNGTTELETVGPVINVNSIAQSNLEPNFILTWGSPSGSCKPDSYTITYAVTQRLACPDPVEAKVVEEINDVDVTTYLLSSLEYYAQYEINITGINGLGPGEMITYSAATFDGKPNSFPVPSVQEEFSAPGELHFNWTEVPCEEIQGKFGRYLYELFYLSALTKFRHNRNVQNRQASFDRLMGCTEYSFRVRITNNEGAGPFSDYIFVTTPTEAPGFVSELSTMPVADVPTSLNITWSSDMTKPCIAEDYNVEYTLSVLDQCDEGNMTEVTMTVPSVAAPGTNIILENLKPYSTYEVAVYASNVGGNSSKVIKMAVTGEQAPTATPTDIKVLTVEYNKLIFSFKDLPCGTRHGRILRYHYELREPQSQAVTNGTTDTLEVMLTDLSRNTEYGFRVRAENSAGLSDFSEEVLQYTDLGLPSAPMELRTFKNPSASAPLTWTAPKMANGNIRNYELHYWETSGNTTEPKTMNITNTDSLRLVITDVEPLKEYTFRVRAINEAGPGAWSNNLTEEVWEGAPSAVVDLMVTGVTENSISLNWSAPLDPKGIVSLYTIEYVVSQRPYSFNDDDSESTRSKTVLPDKTSFVLGDLEPSTEYTVRVMAHTSRAVGAPSMVKQFTLVPNDIPAPVDVDLISRAVSDDGTLIIKLPPISFKYATAYQIGVHCKDVAYQPTFFNGDNRTECSYITGEVPNMEKEQEFVVGDGKTYGDYTNVPLEKDRVYEIYISLVSRTTGKPGVKWAPEPLEAPSESPSLVILWIFIVILFIVLIILVVWCTYTHCRRKENDKKPSGTPEESVPLEEEKTAKPEEP